MSLEEYKAQLAEVEELLISSPDEEDLINLKNDLLQLINLSNEGEESKLKEEEPSSNETSHPQTAADEQAVAAEIQPPSETPLIVENIQKSAAAKKSGKLKAVKDFEVPNHLKPNEADTEGEKMKKKRAVKALKNKWREKKRDFESTKKQKVWQNFNKKKRKEKSIFATNDGVNSKVGVVSGGSLSELRERKRFRS